MVVIFLAAILSFAQAVQAEPGFVLECRYAQDVLGRVYVNGSITDQEKEEIVEMILQHMPINCAVPQLM
jgi:hypothetical protein